VEDMDITIGAIVKSKAGRDKGRHFVVTGIIDENYLLLADGDLRKIEKPKRKKVKHVEYTGDILEALKVKLESKKRITKAEIKKMLSQYLENSLTENINQQF